MSNTMKWGKKLLHLSLFIMSLLQLYDLQKPVDGPTSPESYALILTIVSLCLIILAFTVRYVDSKKWIKITVTIIVFVMGVFSVGALPGDFEILEKALFFLHAVTTFAGLILIWK